MIIKIKQTILFLGDIICLYGALLLALFFRYGNINGHLLEAHILPFSIIFIIWLLGFYIIGLYDINEQKDRFKLLEKVFLGTAVGVTLSIIIFYIIPYFKIAPKTSLVIFSGIFFIAESFWRFFFSLKTKTPEKNLLIFGESKDSKELFDFINENPHLGYKNEGLMPGATDKDELKKIIQQKDIEIIAIENDIIDDKILSELHKNLRSGVEIIDFKELYESVFKKTPSKELENLKIIISIGKKHRIYESIKKPTEKIFALLVFIILSPLIALISLLIKITSRGPIIYKQIRAGKNGKEFKVYKFRTMIEDAEKNGPQWSSGENDKRLTSVGKILRATHTDEIPQLLNIVIGDISFVGPRPERPEFIEQIKKSVPFFEIRNIIKPGLTGWAQTKFKYTSSINDSEIKLQYDIYYAKNRSFILDIIIILKTIKMFFFNYR